jgi:benzoyl-CoA reductase subunit D
MVIAGIDIGAETVKAAIVSDGKILGYSIVKADLDRKTSAEEALELAIAESKISGNRIQRIATTGAGRKEFSYANRSIVEIIADAAGAMFLFPSTRTVIDIGAEEARGIRVNSSGKVRDFVKNDKCAAGAGVFIESMARSLEIRIEEMGSTALRSQRDIPMDVTCAVFAESEVVSMTHSQIPKEDIARAIHEAITTRTISMVKRIGVEKNVTLIGGVAKNIGVVDRFENHLKGYILVPKEPQIVGAIGAAIIAGNEG